MKKTALLILGLALAATGFAKEVSSDEAADVALRLVKSRVQASGVQSVTPVYMSGEKAYYAVNFLPQGWALINADDVVTPVCGYSETGSLSLDEMPDNMRGWLDMRAREMSDFKKVVTERSADWDRLPVMPLATSKIEPIIAVNWNQGKPYNKYCPSNSSGTAYVGCVAVAMGQAMSVAQYPPRPSGYCAYNSSTFGSVYCNYDAEADYNWSNIMSGANDKDEVARLLWHCGVSVKMEYGLSGSGAVSANIASALKTYFGYPSVVKHYSRDAVSNDSEWKAMILAELEAGRAVVYHGTPADGSVGHCFNLDGFDGSSAYHVNWGWGGSGDGYFGLDQLKSQVIAGGSIMEFTTGHGMIVGIRAPNENPTDVTLSKTSVLENQPAGTMVGVVGVTSEAVDPEYSFVVRGPYSVFLKEYLDVPFEVKDGNLVTTEVLSASNTDYIDPMTGEVTYTVTIIATNTALGTSASRDFAITVKSASGIEDVTSSDNAPVEYYNLQGVKVSAPDKGVYIKRQGGKTLKVIF